MSETSANYAQFSGSPLNGTSGDAFAALRRFTRPRPKVERCELCSAALAEVHPHLLDPKQRQILCSCEACALTFCGQQGARYLRVPRRVRFLSGFQVTDMQWESLMLPIHLAFFYKDGSSGNMVAMYPSPSGATESLLHLESWHEIAAGNPALQAMEADVEALLVNRVGEAREYFLVPIDECYRLVGLIRMQWRGLSGGAEVWQGIQQFFADLRVKSGAKRETTLA